MEKLGTRPFVVVYFNAAAELGRIPDPQRFLELHTALHAGHRRQLRVCPVLWIPIFSHGTAYSSPIFPSCIYILFSKVVPGCTSCTEVLKCRSYICKD